MSDILITGASGGIGRALARQLGSAGHALILTGRDADRLRATAEAAGPACHWLVADLTTATGREAVLTACEERGVDIAINNAGANTLAGFTDMDEQTVNGLVAANLTAPMLLTRGLLPLLMSRPAARIVNIGSVFGTLGFPGYSVYSATKFALRGFSEALRRELADSPVQVTYVAPRATRTAFNDTRADALNRVLGNRVDEPEAVARAIARLLDRPGGDYYLGWPEKLVARINALWPGLVTRGLRRRLATIRHYAGLPPDTHAETAHQGDAGATASGRG